MHSSSLASFGCVQHVDLLRVHSSKDCGRLSTLPSHYNAMYSQLLEQLVFLRTLFPTLHWQISPTIQRTSDLLRRKLYSLSTETTIRTTKEKFKER
jgi:hypothetical protein